MPTDRTDDVLTAEERNLCEHVRIDVTACVATIAEGKLLAIIDRLSARLAAAERDLASAQSVVNSLAERVQKQSDLLSQKAERQPIAAVLAELRRRVDDSSTPEGEK